MAKDALFAKFLTEASSKYTYNQAAKDEKALSKDKVALAHRRINDIYNEYNNKINKAPRPVQPSMRMVLDKYKAIADAALDKNTSDNAVDTAIKKFRNNVEKKIGKNLPALEENLNEE